MNDNPDVQEILRRKRVILATMSDLVDEAKSRLADAKQIADDNGLEYSFSRLLEDIQGDINTTWYASDTSHC